MAAWTPWIEREIRGLHQVVRSGDVAVDVGAALGIYTCVLSRLVGPTGVVVSVEPLARLYAAYDAWLRLRKAGNVYRYDGALGAESHTAKVSVPLRGDRPVTGRAFLTTAATGLGSNGEFSAHREYEVPVTTLDRLVNRLDLDRVDFVKADVEGVELALLRGATTTIETSRPTVLLEIEDRHLRRYGHSSGDVVAWFRAHGYEMSAWAEGGWRPVSRVTESRRNYLFRPAVEADA